MKALQALLISSMIIAATGAANAQLGFLSTERSGVELSDADRELLARSIRSVLEAGRVGEVSSWQNPDTGVSGETRLMETYTGGSAPCGRVDFQIRRRDRVAPFDLRFCRKPDGTWGIAG